MLGAAGAAKAAGRLVSMRRSDTAAINPNITYLRVSQSEAP